MLALAKALQIRSHSLLRLCCWLASCCSSITRCSVSFLSFSNSLSAIFSSSKEIRLCLIGTGRLLLTVQCRTNKLFQTESQCSTAKRQLRKVFGMSIHPIYALGHVAGFCYRCGPITSRIDTHSSLEHKRKKLLGFASKLNDRGLRRRLCDPSRGQSSSELGNFLQKLRLPCLTKKQILYSALPGALRNSSSPSALLVHVFRLASKQHWKLMLIYIQLACFTSTGH